MLHSILVSVALLASPTQCCGGCGGLWFAPRPAQCVQLPPVSIAPPSVDIVKLIRIDQYPQPVRIGLTLIAPRPFSSAMAATLQAEAQSQR